MKTDELFQNEDVWTWQEIYTYWRMQLEMLNTSIEKQANFQIIPVDEKLLRHSGDYDWWPKQEVQRRIELVKSRQVLGWGIYKGTVHTVQQLFQYRENAPEVWSLIRS